MGIARWELSGMGTVRDGNCPGWELSTWWELSGMGTVRDGNCPVGIVRDGKCPVLAVRISYTGKSAEDGRFGEDIPRAWCDARRIFGAHAPKS